MSIHLNHINPLKLLNALKDAGIFIKKDFFYEYYPPDSKKDKVVILKPDTFSFSLIGSINENIEISDGGIVNSKEFTKASLKTTLNTYRNIASSVSFVMDDKVSIFSEKELSRSIKRMLLQQAENYGKTHRGNEKTKNGLNYLAPKENVIHLERKVQFKNIDNDIIKRLTNLSNSLYKRKEVYSLNFNINKSLNFSIYHDKKSDIIQYNEVYTITTELHFKNADNQIIPISTIEFLVKDKMNNSKIIKILEKKLLSQMKQFDKFYDLSSGAYTVMFDPSASNVIIHEGFAAHMRSAKFSVDEDSTFFKDREGELIPSLKGVDIIIDPTIDQGYGSYLYDAEGVKAKKVPLVKDGILLGHLTDRASTSRLEQIKKDKKIVPLIVKKVEKNPKLIKKFVKLNIIKDIPFDSLKDQISYLLNEYALNDLITNINIDQSLNWRANYKRLTDHSNGHGRVEDWVSEGNIIQVEPRQSNLVVNVNRDIKQTPEEAAISICKKNNEKFYLKVSSYDGEVDISTALFKVITYSVTKVYIDGRPSKNINCDEYAINLEDFLKHIVYLGNKNETNRGFCGSDSGSITVGSHSPVLIAESVPFVQGVSIPFATKEQFAVLQYKNKSKK